MSEILTQTRAEEAVASAQSFLQSERSAGVDGDFAAQQVTERVVSTKEEAETILKAIPHPRMDGFYVPLSKYNAGQYQDVVAKLSGYFVLVPSSLVDGSASEFYPAVVSEDSLKTRQLRLHVLRQPYRQQVGSGASVILSAAGQSETKGVGEHGRKANDGIEAEHFATLLAAGSDATVKAAWQNGDHINHAWREHPGTSVTTQMLGRLLGNEFPQSTLTISKGEIERGEAMIFWHEGMSKNETGSPETATKENALVVVQSLGYEALRTRQPENLDNVKELIAS